MLICSLLRLLLSLPHTRQPPFPFHPPPVHTYPYPTRLRPPPAPASSHRHPLLPPHATLSPVPDPFTPPSGIRWYAFTCVVRILGTVSDFTNPVLAHLLWLSVGRCNDTVAYNSRACAKMATKNSE